MFHVLEFKAEKKAVDQNASCPFAASAPHLSPSCDKRSNMGRTSCSVTCRSPSHQAKGKSFPSLRNLPLRRETPPEKTTATKCIIIHLT